MTLLLPTEKATLCSETETEILLPLYPETFKATPRALLPSLAYSKYNTFETALVICPPPELLELPAAVLGVSGSF